ncbi:MAG: asparagine synthase (glutamine-hydrolyzing) [bacterium]|nr:asparagine synthase (glutamine-hydrolyzing) [bacterium]
MCGISGIVTRDGRAPDEGRLRRMSEKIRHRGPDGDGILLLDGIGFAHRRLAILDLTEKGSQPMTSPSGRYMIVYNGEIYNYEDLKKELSGEWYSSSDTEVILRGFEEWGTEIFQKLRGMFAIAIWDKKEKKLILARDPVGKKPLFWTQASNGDFYFASEVKAFRGMVPFEVDWNAVRTFLGLQYVPAPKTGFLNISQLEPGTYIEFDSSGFRSHRFHSWSPDLSASQTNATNGEIDAMIREKLNASVLKRQLSSDVPVGAFLSGGIDSAVIVAFASQHSERPIRTFTMGFPDLGMDERYTARQISNVFQTDHDEFEARPEHLKELLDTIVLHYDVPYADSSALPTWLLAKETASEIKVVLTGDGGDEAFGGYRRYGYYLQALRLRSLPVASLLSGLSVPLHDVRFERIAETIRAARRGWARGYGELFTGSYFGRSAATRLMTREFRSLTTGSGGVHFIHDFLKSSQSQNKRLPLEQAMYFDLCSYLPDDLNVKMDRATMAFGLEARSPFLDQDLLSYCLRLPLSQKVTYGKTKVALRRAMRDVLPPAVLSRKKMGFQVPLTNWFRGPLRELVLDRCLSDASPLKPLFRHEEMKRLLNENDSGTDHGNRLWMLVSLSTWLSGVHEIKNDA